MCWKSKYWKPCRCLFWAATFLFWSPTRCTKGNWIFISIKRFSALLLGALCLLVLHGSCKNIWPFGLQTAAVDNVLLPWNTEFHAISMQNHRHLHPCRKCLSGNVMMKTENGGIRWHQIPIENSLNSSHRFEVNPQTHMLKQSSSKSDCYKQMSTHSWSPCLALHASGLTSSALRSWSYNNLPRLGWENKRSKDKFMAKNSRGAFSWKHKASVWFWETYLGVVLKTQTATSNQKTKVLIIMSGP